MYQAKHNFCRLAFEASDAEPHGRVRRRLRRGERLRFDSLDVMLVDRFKRIATSRGEAFKQIVKILFLHGVVHDQVAKELIKNLRVGFGLLVELSLDGVVADECIDDIHKSSSR
jgi:hypothetical protein